jgi:parallel beta-helix repeat protein
MTRQATTVLLAALALSFAVRAKAAPAPVSACGTLAASGSYLLTGNLTASGDCLVVGADFVTLDLAGFVISGNGKGSGVTTSGNPAGVTVRNGVIQNFKTGLDLRAAAGVMVEGVRAFNNADQGLRVGSESLVQGNVATANGNGILVDHNSLVAANVAALNDKQGLEAGWNSTITGNTASKNGQDGLEAGNHNTLSNNTASDNGQKGLSTKCPSNVVANTAAGNKLNLIALGGPSKNPPKNLGKPCKLVDNVAP